MHRNCTICGKPIVLRPSAEERARKYGGKPSDYTALFTRHPTCVADELTQEARKVMDTVTRMPLEEAANILVVFTLTGKQTRNLLYAYAKLFHWAHGEYSIHTTGIADFRDSCVDLLRRYAEHTHGG